MCDLWFQIWRLCRGRDDFWPSILILFGLGRTCPGTYPAKSKANNRHGPHTAASLKSAVTHIQILLYYSTLVQTNDSHLQSSREKCGVFRRKSREFVMLRTLRGSITKYQLTRSFPHSHAHNLDRPSHSSKSKPGSVLSQ